METFDQNNLNNQNIVNNTQYSALKDEITSTQKANMTSNNPINLNEMLHEMVDI